MSIHSRIINPGMNLLSARRKQTGEDKHHTKNEWISVNSSDRLAWHVQCLTGPSAKLKIALNSQIRLSAADEELRIKYTRYQKALNQLLDEFKDFSRKEMDPYLMEDYPQWKPMGTIMYADIELRLFGGYNEFYKAVNSVEQVLKEFASTAIFQVRETANGPEVSLVEGLPQHLTSNVLLLMRLSAALVDWEHHFIISCTTTARSAKRRARLEEKLRVGINDIERLIGRVQQAIPDRFLNNTNAVCWGLHIHKQGSSSTRFLKSPRSANFKIGQVMKEGDVQETLHTECPRNKVNQIDFAPSAKFEAICKIRMQFPGNVCKMGSAFLVKNDIVVTAGHNVFNPTLGHAEIIEVYVGFDGSNPGQNRHGKFAAVHACCYDNPHQSLNDFAMVKLSMPFSGVEPLRWRRTPSQGQFRLGVVGYPGGDELGTDRGKYMYESWEDNVEVNLETNDMVLAYHVSTTGGSSGSPLLFQDIDGQLTVIGVHCRGGNTTNSASAIGHIGNDIPAFMTALAVCENPALTTPQMNVRSVPGPHSGPLGVVSISVPLPPKSETHVFWLIN